MINDHDQLTRIYLFYVLHVVCLRFVRRSPLFGANISCPYLVKMGRQRRDDKRNFQQDRQQRDVQRILKKDNMKYWSRNYF